MAGNPESVIAEMLRAAGIPGEISLTTPPNPELGDFAFGCFGPAKEWKIPPAEAAKKIRHQLEIGNTKSEIIERIEISGPYVNFYLKTEVLAELVLQAVFNKMKKRGAGNGKRVLIEYPSNNTHKELHVGHLRNICIGNSLVKIFEASGYRVIPVNYVNDFGAHVAKCLWGLLKFHKDETPPENKQEWLGRIYAEASRYLDDHPEDKEDVYTLQQKLEKKDKSIYKLFLTTRKWSLDGFARIFRELGVKHRAVFYEKDVKDVGQKIVDGLLEKGIAKTGEGGAIIADLSPYGLDIGLLRKSNGGGLYLTSDLGLAVTKNKKYPGISESVHITGDEQNFYFKQLFKILDLAGYKYKMTHIGYGLVTLPTGKMSSRLGNVILYEDVFDSVYKKVSDETKLKHPEWTERKLRETSRKITLAAVKFDFLKHEAGKVIVFDAAAASSFDGFTGPYVLYAIARINSMLKKVKQQPGRKIDYKLLDKPEEKALLLIISRYHETVEKAFGSYNPSVIVKYCFDLAKQYNDFYAKHSVLKAESGDLMRARLELSSAVRQVLQNALNLLTIEKVEEM